MKARHLMIAAVLGSLGTVLGACAAGDPEADSVEATNLEAPTLQAATWTEVFLVRGTGVTNCNLARATSEASALCNELAQKQTRESTTYMYAVKDVNVFNYGDHFEHPTFGPRSCSFQANYKCDIRRGRLEE
jgi:hypothetical protein